MTYEAFELAVIDLASKRVRLTVANVAAFTKVTPTQVEAWLDQMSAAGRLECELDENLGLIYYRVRGLSDVGHSPNSWAVTWPITPAPIHYPTPRRQKNVVLGAIFALLFPGFGLIYCAPLSATFVATLVIFLAVKMAGAFPLIGGLLGSVTLGVCALASAFLATMYVRKYNAEGKRGHVHAEATRIAERRIAQHVAP